MSRRVSVDIKGRKKARMHDKGEEERASPGHIAELLAYPVYSLAAKINAEFFQAVAHRRGVSTQALHWHVLLNSVCFPQRLALVCRGRLGAMVVQKLIRFGGERAVTSVRRALKHASSVMLRKHFVGLKDNGAACVLTLQGHSRYVVVDVSAHVAFHPSAPYLATCGSDDTAKLWR